MPSVEQILNMTHDDFEQVMERYGMNKVRKTFLMMPFICLIYKSYLMTQTTSILQMRKKIGKNHKHQEEKIG